MEMEHGSLLKNYARFSKPNLVALKQVFPDLELLIKNTKLSGNVTNIKRLEFGIEVHKSLEISGVFSGDIYNFLGPTQSSNCVLVSVLQL
jgi:hypothetical protein